MVVECHWDDENREMLALRGLTPAEVEHALENGALDPDVGNMSGWPVLFGRAPDGRTVAVMFVWESPGSIYVLDAQVES
jgi:hypothetical protein